MRFACAWLFLSAVALAADPQVACRVSLKTDPSGATVIVDGKDRGTTPIMLYDLAPGRHHVKFRCSGYDESDRFFDTSEGPFVERNTVLKEQKGLLLLKTEPEGCDIQIDGVSVGRTPRLVTTLSVRDVHSVRLRKAGYQDQMITVKFEGRKPLVREERLVLASGTLDVLSEPAGAEVTVNGIVRGRTPLKVTGVPKGRAVVKFRLDGFAEEIRELSVNAGDVQTLPVVLKGLPGTLHLSSVPDGARIYVDERYEGKAPVALAGLKPGAYAVRAELDGYGTQSRTVTLVNGGSASEEFRLSNVMGRLEVVTAPPGARLTLDGRLVGVTKAATPNAEFSDPFVVENVLEGEHRLVVSKEGYSDFVRHPNVQNQRTAQHRIRLRRIFTPDIEIVTSRGTYRGVLVSNTPESVVVEVSLGITSTFPRSEIRKVTFLTPERKD